MLFPESGFRADDSNLHALFQRKRVVDSIRRADNTGYEGRETPIACGKYAGEDVRFGISLFRKNRAPQEGNVKRIATHRELGAVNETMYTGCGEGREDLSVEEKSADPGKRGSSGEIGIGSAEALQFHKCLNLGSGFAEECRVGTYFAYGGKALL